MFLLIVALAVAVVVLQLAPTSVVAFVA